MRRIESVAVMGLALVCSVYSAQRAEQEDALAPSQEERSTAAQPQRDGFFSYVTKMINPKDTDYGKLIADRRAALADASATNSYFWYGAVSTGTVLVLLFVLYVEILEQKSYRWRAAEVITDLRNAEKLATAKAREAIATYKRHMIECNRVVEAEVAGRLLPGTALSRDMESKLEGLREQLQAKTAENLRLAEQLEKKEELYRDLVKRMDLLEQASPSEVKGTAGAQPTNSELLALVSRLTRDLDVERRRNGALKGA